MACSLPDRRFSDEMVKQNELQIPVRPYSFVPRLQPVFRQRSECICEVQYGALQNPKALRECEPELCPQAHSKFRR